MAGGWAIGLLAILSGCATPVPLPVEQTTLRDHATVQPLPPLSVEHSAELPNKQTGKIKLGSVLVSTGGAVAASVRDMPVSREFIPTMATVSYGVEYHVWQPLTRPPSAPWITPHFKMYTYVLFNGAAYHAKLNYDEKQALQRLNRLLDTIGRAEDNAGASENQGRSTQATNLFLIPALSAAVTSATLETYHLGLSRQYLDYFGSALAENNKMHKQLRKTGPFLLSTLKPIGEILTPKADGSYQIDRTQPILLVDMTGAHEKSVAEVVRTFKNHLADAPLTGVEAFNPLRLKLVSLLLKLNDAIPIVNNAVAGTCGMVGAERACPK